MEACTRETSGTANQTVEVEVDWTYTDSAAMGKQASSWKPEGHRRRRRPRRSWRKMIKEEAEIVGKIWRAQGNNWKESPLALLCGGPVLQIGATGI